MPRPLKKDCPFERVEGDDCYLGLFDENGNFVGEWCCVNYDPVEGCKCEN